MLNIEIFDNIKTIRDFVAENKFLEQNPKLTMLDVKRKITDGVKSIQDEVHEDLFNDSVTDNCYE